MNIKIEVYPIEHEKKYNARRTFIDSRGCTYVGTNKEARDFFVKMYPACTIMMNFQPKKRG